jgi:hypothetical protein
MDFAPYERLSAAAASLLTGYHSAALELWSDCVLQSIGPVSRLAFAICSPSSARRHPTVGKGLLMWLHY